jgi:hypothetical protein
MSNLRDAARQALKSLRGYRRELGCQQPCDAERALEAALEQPEQEPMAKSTWQKLYEAAIDQRNEAVALNQELLEALKECLPYVGQTLANTGSMDAYYTEAKACAAINAAERNT